MVEATRDGRPLGGEAYVELTGYAPTIGRRAPTPSGRVGAQAIGLPATP